MFYRYSLLLMSGEPPCFKKAIALFNLEACKDMVESIKYWKKIIIKDGQYLDPYALGPRSLRNLRMETLG